MMESLTVPAVLVPVMDLWKAMKVVSAGMGTMRDQRLPVKEAGSGEPFFR